MGSKNMLRYNLITNKAFDSFEYEQHLLQQLSADEMQISDIGNAKHFLQSSTLGNSYHTLGPAGGKSCRLAEIVLNKKPTVEIPAIQNATANPCFENMEDRQHNDAVKSEYAKTLPILRQNPQLDMQVLPNVLAA